MRSIDNPENTRIKDGITGQLTYVLTNVSLGDLLNKLRFYNYGDSLFARHPLIVIDTTPTAFRATVTVDPLTDEQKRVLS